MWPGRLPSQHDSSNNRRQLSIVMRPGCIRLWLLPPPKSDTARSVDTRHAYTTSTHVSTSAREARHRAPPVAPPVVRPLDRTRTSHFTRPAKTSSRARRRINRQDLPRSWRLILLAGLLSRCRGPGVDEGAGLAPQAAATQESPTTWVPHAHGCHPIYRKFFRLRRILSLQR